MFNKVDTSGYRRNARQSPAPHNLRYSPLNDHLMEERNPTRSRPGYFSDFLSLREVQNNSPREQINHRSHVIIEIKTNIKVSVHNGC
jgi:hypothetical protein